MSEFDFMNRAARATGCGILLDVNNIYVQSYNHGLDPWEYIDGIELGLPGEMHVAGHIEQETDDGGKILVDTHSRPVKGAVWDLYEHAVRRFGRVPTLIEWDQDFPEFSVLEAEAEKARTIMKRVLSSSCHPTAGPQDLSPQSSIDPAIKSQDDIEAKHATP